MSLKGFLTLLMPFNKKNFIVLDNVSPFWLNLPYKVRISDRYDHMHIIGTAGKGKSKLLEHMIYQDAIFGRGVALIDPHGNLADDVLSYLGNSGFFKIPGNLGSPVYVNFSRFTYVVSKQRKATLIKTIEVLDQGFNKNTLDKIKTESAKIYGRPYKEVMKETRERYFSKNHNQNIVKEFEPL